MHEPSALRASPSQLADVQAQLLAWTSALIDADRHHVDTEMQGAVHMVLSCVRDASSHPHVLTQASLMQHWRAACMGWRQPPEGQAGSPMRAGYPLDIHHP